MEKFYTIHASHVEAPDKKFFVRFYHRSHRPDGCTFRKPGTITLVEVRAQTEQGALRIAQYHFGFTGLNFRIERREAKKISLNTVEFEGPAGMGLVYIMSNEPGKRIGLVDRGERGYTLTDMDQRGYGPDQVKELVAEGNLALGISPEEAEAMLVGSMFGWDCPGAQPIEHKAA